MRNLSYENDFCMQFHFHANQSHFHENGFALRLALKQKHKGTRKWPIYLPFPQVAPCVNNTKVDFSWTVTCTGPSAQQKVESSPLFQATRSQAILRISQGVLIGGVTCTFDVTGSMNYNPNIKSMVSQDIKALSSPLQTAIFGGKVVGVGY